MWARGRLDRVALTNFAVDPARLTSLLLPGVEPATIAVVDGRADAALVSAVSFVAHDLSIAGLPGARFSGGHVDYRAAVRSPSGEPAVWFLGAAMSSPLAWGLHGLWGMPWHRASVSVRQDRGGYLVDVADHRWMATIEAGTDAEADSLDGFDHVDHAADVLVNARLGLFRGRGGRLSAYRAEHSPPRPRIGRSRRARVELFEQLGLVEPGAAPHSVLLVGGFDIAIELPPRPIAH